MVSVRLFVQAGNNFAKIRFRKFVANVQKQFFTTAEFYFRPKKFNFAVIKTFFQSQLVAGLQVAGDPQQAASSPAPAKPSGFDKFKTGLKNVYVFARFCV